MVTVDAFGMGMAFGSLLTCFAIWNLIQFGKEVDRTEIVNRIADAIVGVLQMKAKVASWIGNRF